MIGRQAPSHCCSLLLEMSMQHWLIDRAKRDLSCYLSFRNLCVCLSVSLTITATSVYRLLWHSESTYLVKRSIRLFNFPTASKKPFLVFFTVTGVGRGLLSQNYKFNQFLNILYSLVPSSHHPYLFHLLAGSKIESVSMSCFLFPYVLLSCDIAHSIISSVRHW